MSKQRDLTGLHFGYWTVIKKAGRSKHRHTLWLCKCVCGNESIIPQPNLITNKSLNCGCKRAESIIKHDLSHHELYRRWSDMKTRCYNPNFKFFNNYGGRGIKVCKQWKNDFMAFYNWAINNGYEKGFSIDRINVNGNYEPSNCRWVTKEEQATNKRNTKYVTYNGETKALSIFCKELNLQYDIVKGRLKIGWSVEKAFETPMQKY